MVQRPMVDANDFPLINHSICVYCKNVVVAWTNDNGADTKYGCGIRREGEKYVGVDEINGKINFFKGCEKFESSGISTHSLLVDILVKGNPLARTIPFSDKAEEEGILFEKKVTYNLPESQRVKWEDIASLSDKL